jgi:DNA topoisomerase-3
MAPKLPSVLKRLDMGPYKPFVSYALGLPSLPITKRLVDNAKVTDHHAIIPTEATSRIASLSPDELKIYDLVARRFIASFFPAYVYDVTSIVSLVEGEQFLTKGNTVVERGWMGLYPQDINEKDAPVLPNVKKGEPIKVKDVQCPKKKTQPPKLYTEAALLSAMENAGRFVDNEELAEAIKESGLGTPATRAAIIERLLTVGYITRKAKSLAPTEKGMKLIEAVPPELKSPETTGKWEKGLSSVAKSNMDPDKFMLSIKRYVNFLVSSAKASEKAIEFPAEDRKRKSGRKAAIAKLGACPQCGTGEVLENTKAFYCTRWQEGCKFNVWKNELERFSIAIDKDMAKKLARDGEAEAKGMLNGQEREFLISFDKGFGVRARVK